jgi:hypothetical protein
MIVSRSRANLGNSVSSIIYIFRIALCWQDINCAFIVAHPVRPVTVYPWQLSREAVMFAPCAAAMLIKDVLSLATMYFKAALWPN